MSELTANFMNFMKNKEIDSKILVPILIWGSGSQSNIENAQCVNRLFFNVDKDILSRKLVLNNKLHHFLKYPKAIKNDKLDFMYKDIATYFGWTDIELSKNMNVIDIEALKPLIARTFGYDNKERRKIGVNKIVLN